jgi:hypothetical protein
MSNTKSLQNKWYVFKKIPAPNHTGSDDSMLFNEAGALQTLPLATHPST